MPSRGRGWPALPRRRDLHWEIGLGKFVSRARFRSSSLSPDGLKIKCRFLRYWHKLKIKANSFHNPAREFPLRLPELVTETMVICFHFGFLSFVGRIVRVQLDLQTKRNAFSVHSFHISGASTKFWTGCQAQGARRGDLKQGPSLVSFAVYLLGEGKEN